MPDMRKFVTPREIVWGRGSVSYLENIEGRRVLIVTDKAMNKLGIVASAESYLRKGGLEVAVFDDIEPDPSINTVMKVVEEYKEFSPDIIVGLGGGSPIDASKAVRVFLEHAQLAFEDVWVYGGRPAKTTVPPLKNTISVTIPSTSGTGSEVSRACVITDPTIPAKCSFGSHEVIPNIAIVDPDIADSMPKSVQADSGFDALTHAMASYVSVQASDFTRVGALQGAKLLMEYLPSAYMGNDKDAKEHLHYAATIIGVAFSNSGLGIDHIIAYLFGGAFHLPHGRICSIALPYVIEFNAITASDRYAELAQAIGYSGSGQIEAVNYLIKRVVKLKKQLRMPGSFREAGVPEAAYHSKLKEFIEQSPGFPMMKTNPRQATAHDLEQLYNACYYGHSPS